MPPRSRISIAKPDIVETLHAQDQRVFTRTQLDQILIQNRREWRLVQSTTANTFIDFLLRNADLQLHKFKLPNRPTNRYAWGNVPTLEIVQTLRPNGYFTHFSALQIHQLTEQIPKTIYLNFEQQATGGGGQLTQEGINRAFKGKCRVSKNVAEFREQRICVLNGKNTGMLGVTDFETAEGSNLKVTDIERTLIDITVRPIYSGGVFEVARAFAAAHGKFSVNKLASYLQRMNFTYPYHQSIGYYLEKSGTYSETQLSLLRQFERNFDFFLDYGMKETYHVEAWRLFVPKGF